MLTSIVGVNIQKRDFGFKAMERTLITLLVLFHTLYSLMLCNGLYILWFQGA